jgi:hypothetical protein
MYLDIRSAIEKVCCQDIRYCHGTAKIAKFKIEGVWRDFSEF